MSERLLRIVIFMTMLSSFFVFVEPSPHDCLMGILLILCVPAHVRLERLSLPLLLLLLVWNVAGLMSLLNVPDNVKAIQYTGTSLYLATAALLFTCLFAQNNNMSRLAAMRAAYIAAALITAVAGIVGYFNLLPGAATILTVDERASGFFKDPNVFGPFLIWPALFVTARMLFGKIRLRDICVLSLLLAGLFLSFSRGAWIHFALSAVVMLALLFVTAPNARFRVRLVGLSLIGLCALAALMAALLSFSAVRDLFLMRANALNYYDVGQGGRFQLQELALGVLLDFPNGMGPFEFARVYGLQQHNVYLQAFMVYGWIGGMAYILMLLVTLLLGLRAAMVSTPWQAYVITAVAAFVGEIVEGAVIDTDHWRHFYLLLGLIWGLSAATINFVREQRMASLPAFPPGMRGARLA